MLTVDEKGPYSYFFIPKSIELRYKSKSYGLHINKYEIGIVYYYEGCRRIDIHTRGSIIEFENGT